MVQSCFASGFIAFGTSGLGTEVLRFRAVSCLGFLLSGLRVQGFRV